MRREEDVEVTVHGGRARIRVRGHLDLEARGAFVAAVEQVGAATAVEIDLRGLAFIDSTGLTSLIEADRAIHAGTGSHPRILVSDDGPVRRMLELTLLHLTLDVRVA